MVTLTTAALSLLLGATGAEGTPGASEPMLTPSPEVAPALNPEAVDFDALPERPRSSDDVRIKRFLGAFTGGVVGLGAMLALMPLGDVATCLGGTCLSPGQGITGLLAPLISLGGAWVGFQVMGGDGALLAPSVALLPAGLVALLLLNIARDMGAESALQLMPSLIASGVMLAGGAALALDLRARQLQSLGGAEGFGRASPGRVALTALVSGLAVTASAFLTMLVLALCQGNPACYPLPVAVGLATTVAAAAAVWGTHRAMDGRGSFLASLGGLTVGVGATMAAVVLYLNSQSGGFGFNPVRSISGLWLAIELGAMAGLFVPLLALEWSHTNALEASLPKFVFSAAPTPNGGMVGASMRF